ncbi:hypothetical protein K5Y32_07390 [Pantoea sp. DY-15]|uniref:hypothetical protein n=1 Tax=Pantoea sp. DY-15 TaxID=2871489 RepID=UPI001C949D3B|nr:hypothetical protein [Pantoea sp. DY-15]MBY4887756.1 hypothetical protein [Pantoea sp. DY-15]
MTNQQLKAHCEDVIANPQDHLDWMVDMARVALASLEAEPVAVIYKTGEVMSREECNEPFDCFDIICRVETPLYKAQPAESMKFPEVLRPHHHSFKRANAERDGWNACISETKRLNGVTS